MLQERRIRTLVYTLLPIATFFALLELAGRIGLAISKRPKDAPLPALLGNDNSWCKPSTTLGWEGIPFYSGFPYGAKVALNSKGFRSEDLGPKAPDRFRILYIGDSVTFGYGIDKDKTFPYQTETILEGLTKGLRIETYNAGVPGYTSFQGLRLLGELCEAVTPDAVVWAFGYNDRRLANLEPDSDHILRLVGLLGYVNQYAGPLIRHSGLLTLIYGRSRSTTARRMSGPPRVTVEAFASNRNEFIRYAVQRHILPVVVILRDNPTLESRLRSCEKALADGHPDAAYEGYRAADDLAVQLLTRRYGALRLAACG